ncbi:hypothetical protein [Streptomyces sp. DH12]|uniref:hypothetical protein n=1 Tax=Streptomyces sp. DH12 TaxID=2857010 RepID=UPI001E463A89|nr:hypothetical protein [Streptomyces sp. DH12]
MAVGCGRHSAAIYDRDGALVATADELVEVEWTRVLDDVSSARIVVRPDGDCCAAFARVRSWRHRLVIWRDGRLVWEGPVLLPMWSTDGVEVHAVDILAWLDRRVPHRDQTFIQKDLTDIAAWLIQDGFEPDDPGHSVDILAPSRVWGDREYLRDVGQTGEHLRDLADTGLDFTAVGSRIVLMPEDHCARVGALTDADFPDGLTVAEDGGALATRWVVHGHDDVKGEAGGPDPYYGLLERSIEETSILDHASAAAAARSRHGGTVPAPVFIDSQNATLASDAAVDVPSLVPGWCVDVTTTATCRTITQALKIIGVKVVENGERESVGVQLAPGGVS